MSKIVVAKLVRLGQDGDKFKKGLIAKTERKTVKIDDEFIEEFNKRWETSGRLYVVDESATKERDASLVKEVKPEPNKDKEIRDALKLEADGLNITYAKNVTNEKLAELISAVK